VSSATRTRLVGLDPEGLRTRLERGMVHQLRRRLGAGWEARWPDYEHTSATLEVDAWMGCLAAEPRLHRIADEARDVLGIDRQVEVHPTNERLAAAHRAEGGPLVVSIHWRSLAHLDDDALLAVLGHELGHHLAHNGARADGPDPRLVYWRLHDDRSSEIREVAAAYSRASELTADRFALLACQDLDAVLRLFASLSPSAAVEDTEGFLASSKRRAEDLLGRKVRASGDSHPEMAVRAYAVWLFSQSDAYRRLTRRGPGSRPLRDIDMALASLVGPSDDAVEPFDEPTWMDGVGEAIYEGSDRIGQAIAQRVAQIGATLRGVPDRRAPGSAPDRPPPQPRAPERDAEDDPVAEVEEDELESRFRELERRMASERGR
jgi:hypothetical protein